MDARCAGIADIPDAVDVTFIELPHTDPYFPGRFFYARETDLRVAEWYPPKSEMITGENLNREAAK
ncbi:hypothetical protein AMJ86_07190 [bacterium SM23_57]|nr:MAG: hypothetical protein AMJ86_07190 [bacterium SM23_57]